MRLAMIQMNVVHSKEENLAHARELLRQAAGDGVKVYSPCLRREEAAQRETGNFLNRVYKGSVSMMMSAITQKQELTREEIDELYAILRQAEEGRQDD